MKRCYCIVECRTVPEYDEVEHLYDVDVVAAPMIDRGSKGPHQSETQLQRSKVKKSVGGYCCMLINSTATEGA